MYPSVIAAFPVMSKKFEGYLPWMYVDVENLVTTGMGNLIDPIENALNLPWRHGLTGPLASQQEIMADWNTVKHSGMTKAGGGNQGSLTTLRLDDAGIQAVIGQKLTNNESILRKRFPGWDHMPADAQLALLSMAWAMGANFNYPKFQGYVNQLVPDYRKAAIESYMPDNAERNINFPPKLNPGLRPRNIANRQLFINAANAIAAGSALDQIAMPMNQLMDIAHAGVDAVTEQITALKKTAVANKGKIMAGYAALSVGVVGTLVYLDSKGKL